MHIILVANPKGGSGKTTIAVNLAGYYASAGRRTGLFDLDARALDALASDERAWESAVQEFMGYRAVWHRHGVLAMLRALMHARNLAASLLASPYGERRLTNFLHLGELLQQVSSELDGEYALLRWLGEAVSRPNGQDAEQVLRLESERKLVQIARALNEELDLTRLLTQIVDAAIQEDAQAIVTPSPYSGPESAYRLAFTDTEFLLREELRPVRMQLELLKPELVQQAHGIENTIVVFGSARFRGEADAAVFHLGDDSNPDLRAWMAFG